MSQQVSKEDDNLIQLTDRPLVVSLWAKGFLPIEYFKAGYKTVFVFQREETKALREMWKLGVPIAIDDIREVFKVEQSFNSAVHDD